MEHIAIDLGGRESQVCVRRPDGSIMEERRLPTRGVAAYLKGHPRARIVMETCSESWPIADAARAHGHDVRVVPSTLVRSLGVGARRTKTDQRDAQALSAASCRLDLPTVHVPSAMARARRTLCGTREALVAARTQLVNTVRGWLRQQGIDVGRGMVASLPRRVRAACGDTLPPAIARQLETIDHLVAQVAAADRDLAAVVRHDAVAQRLVTAPGIGPVTAVRFLAAVDAVDRFADAHALESYLGIVPGEHSSSGHTRRLRITKAGPAPVRRALVQAAWVARHARPHDPLVRWAAGVQHRRGAQVAAVALARKLAGVLYALWRDGTTYDPDHHRPA